MNKFLGLLLLSSVLSFGPTAQATSFKLLGLDKLFSGQKGGGEVDRGRVIAHCHFTNDADNRYDAVNLKVFKNTTLPVGGGSLRSGRLEIRDRIGNLVEEKDFPVVYSQRVRKESAGPYGEALTAAQMLGITQADSLMLYGIELNLERPIGLAVVHDVDDDPIDRFVLWGKKAYRCEGQDDGANSCTQR
jgi:hypothetical protein